MQPLESTVQHVKVRNGLKTYTITSNNERVRRNSCIVVLL